MTAREEDRLNAYNNLISLIRKNRAVTFMMPAFGDSVEELTHIIRDINSNEIQIRKNTDKDRLNRTIAADSLIDNLKPVIAALYLLSKDTSNVILKENVRLDEIKLKHMNYADLLDKSNLILQWAKEEMKSLMRYGIDIGHIERLTESLNLYKKELKSKEAEFEGENLIKNNLTGLFEAADELVSEEIDNFAEILRPFDPPFYRQYRDFRSGSI